VSLLERRPSFLAKIRNRKSSSSSSVEGSSSSVYVSEFESSCHGIDENNLYFDQNQNILINTTLVDMLRNSSADLTKSPVCRIINDED
jgi:hypothetical protein